MEYIIGGIIMAAVAYAVYRAAQKNKASKTSPGSRKPGEQDEHEPL